MPKIDCCLILAVFSHDLIHPCMRQWNDFYNLFSEIKTRDLVHTLLFNMTRSDEAKKNRNFQNQFVLSLSRIYIKWSNKREEEKKRHSILDSISRTDAYISSTSEMFYRNILSFLKSLLQHFSFRCVLYAHIKRFGKSFLKLKMFIVVPVK